MLAGTWRRTRRLGVATVVLLALYGDARATLPWCPMFTWAWLFFDSGSAQIKERDEKLIQRIVRFAKMLDADVVISGHADAAESDKEARARGDAAKAVLAAHGIPAEHIEVRSYGNSRLLVPTAVGVVEPQNRRVEMHLANWRRKADDPLLSMQLPDWYARDCEPGGWQHPYCPNECNNAKGTYGRK